MEKYNISELRSLCQKNENEVFLTDKYIFRKVSIYFTKVFILLRVSSNFATLLSLIAALASCYFLLFNTRTALLTSALLIGVYWILDYVDGELARFYIHTNQMKPSLKGKYFDYLVHFFSSNLMFLFMGIGIYNQYKYSWAVFFGISACIGISNFPNFVCSTVILEAINYGYKNNNIRPGYIEIADILDGNSANIKAITQGSFKAKAIILIKELLIFPGCLNALYTVCILDAFIVPIRIGSIFLTFRVLYIVFFAAVTTLNTFRKSVFWLNKLDSVN